MRFFALATLALSAAAISMATEDDTQDADLAEIYDDDVAELTASESDISWCDKSLPGKVAKMVDLNGDRKITKQEIARALKANGAKAGTKKTLYKILEKAFPKRYAANNVGYKHARALVMGIQKYACKKK